MKTLIVIALLTSTTAFANITCKGAVALSLKDAKTITEAMNSLPLQTNLAMVWVQRDINNLGNITAACEVQFEEKENFCSQMETLITAREPGIMWNVSGTDDDKDDLRLKNQSLLKKVLKICK